MTDHPLAKWAARLSGTPENESPMPASGKVPKRAVLYLHVLADADDYQTQYQCKDCFHWIADTEKCVLHEASQLVRADGSCGYFLYGSPDLADEGAKAGVAHQPLTPEESGYDENDAGFSCKRCEAFMADSSRCKVVDAESIGDDPGRIHPDACCAAWQPGKRAASSEGEFARKNPTRA